MKISVKLFSISLFLFFLLNINIADAKSKNTYIDHFNPNSGSNDKWTCAKELSELKDRNEHRIIEVVNPAQNKKSIKMFGEFLQKCELVTKVSKYRGKLEYLYSEEPLIFMIIVNKEEKHRGYKHAAIENIAASIINPNRLDRVSGFYLELGKEYMAFFFMTQKPLDFLNAILDESEPWSSAGAARSFRHILEPEKGEKILFIPLGMIPEIEYTMYFSGKEDRIKQFSIINIPFSCWATSYYEYNRFSIDLYESFSGSQFENPYKVISMFRRIYEDMRCMNISKRNLRQFYLPDINDTECCPEEKFAEGFTKLEIDLGLDFEGFDWSQMKAVSISKVVFPTYGMPMY